ncbi:hypothetical protein [Novosphingobium aerophilum]|uniref:hypothetical protein n=1 Tax=Novosphingobium aerophilum TaxID=2839843 RepID=UPI003FCF9B80
MSESRSWPKNHEVENEMIRTPAVEGDPPAPATAPNKKDENARRAKDGSAPPGNIREVGRKR